MSARTFTRPGIALLLAACFLAAACGRDEAAAPAGGTAPPPPTASALEVTDVELGTAVGSDRRITNATDDFAPTDTIYVSVLTSGGEGTTAELTARFTYQDGQLVDESSQSVRPTGSDATEFHVSKPDGWPAGDYQVEILVDGRSVERKEFEVE